MIFDFNNIIHIFIRNKKKVNPVTAVLAPFPLIFFQIYLLHWKLIVYYSGKVSLAKKIPIFDSAFFLKLPNQ